MYLLVHYEYSSYIGCMLDYQGLLVGWRILYSTLTRLWDQMSDISEGHTVQRGPLILKLYFIIFYLYYIYYINILIYYIIEVYLTILTYLGILGILP